MGIGKMIITKVASTLVLGGVMLYADYKINGDYSAIGIVKRIRQAVKHKETEEVKQEAHIVSGEDYQIQ